MNNENINSVNTRIKNKNVNPVSEQRKTNVSAPSQIRISSSIKQRFRKMLVILLYTIIVGFSIFFAQSFSIENGQELSNSLSLFYLMISIVGSLALVLMSGFVIFYTAETQNSLSLGRFFRHFINTFLPLISLILMVANAFPSLGDPVDTIANSISIFIYLNIAGALLSMIIMIGFAIKVRALFPKTIKFTMAFLPGVFITAIGLLLIAFNVGTGIHYVDYGFSRLMVEIILMLSGVVALFSGTIVVVRESEYENKLKKLIKSGHIAHLLIAFTILACSMVSNFNLENMSNTTPLVVLIIQVLATILMSAYIILSSRLKRIQNINPLFNKISLMCYIIFVNILGVLVVYISPGIGGDALQDTVKLTEFTSTFMALSAVLTIIILFIAGSVSFVTIEFNPKVSTSITFVEAILVVALISVVFAASDSAIISDLMGRFIVLIIYLTIIVLYLIGEMYWVIFLLIGDKKNNVNNTQVIINKKRKKLNIDNSINDIEVKESERKKVENE